MNGEIRDAAFVHAAVACARGQASAAKRVKQKLDEVREASTIKRRRRRRIAAELDEMAAEAKLRRQRSALLKAAREAAAAGVVSVSRDGSERRAPKFKRHAACSMSDGSDQAGWSKPSVDRDGLASVILRLWAGTSLSLDQLAALARYIIDALALSGQAAEVVFTNILNDQDAEKGTDAFEQKLVSFCRSLSQLEHDVARKASGEPKIQVYRHLAIALPAGLSHDARIRVSERVIRPLVDADLPVIASIQAPSMTRGAKDPRNFHLQLAVGTRPFKRVDAGVYEFSLLKNGEILGPDGLRQWREHIACVFNVALADCGIDVRYTSKAQHERGLGAPLPDPALAERPNHVQLVRAASQQISTITNLIAVVQESKLLASRIASVSAASIASAAEQVKENGAKAVSRHDLGPDDRCRNAGTRALQLFNSRLAKAVELERVHATINASKRLSGANQRVEAARELINAQIAMLRQKLWTSRMRKSASEGLLSLDRLDAMQKSALKYARSRIGDAAGARVLLEMTSAARRLKHVEEEAHCQRTRFNQVKTALAIHKQVQFDFKRWDASGRITAVTLTAVGIHRARLKTAREAAVQLAGLRCPLATSAASKDAIAAARISVGNLAECSAANGLDARRIQRVEDMRFRAVMAASTALQTPPRAPHAGLKPSFRDRARESIAEMLAGVGAGASAAVDAAAAATEVIRAQIQRVVDKPPTPAKKQTTRPGIARRESEPINIEASSTIDDAQTDPQASEVPSPISQAADRIAETSRQMVDRALAMNPWAKLEARAAAKRKTEEARKATEEAEREKEAKLHQEIQELKRIEEGWQIKFREIIHRNQMLIDNDARFDDPRRYIHEQDFALVAAALQSGGQRYRFMLASAFSDARLPLRRLVEKATEAEARAEAARSRSLSVDRVAEPPKRGSGHSKWRSPKSHQKKGK